MKHFKKLTLLFSLMIALTFSALPVAASSAPTEVETFSTEPGGSGSFHI